MKHRALVIGWRGGVGSALLHLLATHPTGRALVAHLDALFLIDREPLGTAPEIPDACVLEAATIDPESLGRAIRDHRIDQVIEVADVDTQAIASTCARHGVDYVSASIGGVGATMEIASRVLAERLDTRGASHLLGSGMNPGIVEALAVAGQRELRRACGAQELELYAIHVTEQDTTTWLGGDPGDAFACSWSPEHALEELLEPHAMYVARGKLVRAPHAPHQALYAARCGDREIEAMLVPHEELVSIGARFPDVEAGFFYAIPEVAQHALMRHPERRPQEWKTRRMYHPHVAELSGTDRVGCLLASRRHGELWIGFAHRAEEQLAHGNATLLQTAAGVLAGWTLLGARRGVHVVGELDADRYLGIVTKLLGPLQIEYAPSAPVRPVTARRLDRKMTLREKPPGA